MNKREDIEFRQYLDSFMNHNVVIKYYEVTIGKHSSLMKYKLENNGFNPDNAFGDDNEVAVTEEINLT